jgi:hypothetical protein
MNTGMHNRFDQLGKTLGLEALAPSGRTVAHDEIAPNAHHADLRHGPHPAHGAERARLGLLGRIASVPCLIELFSGAPHEDEALACAGKLIAFRQKRRRDSRKKPHVFVRPFMWIVTARRPTSVLAALAAVRARGWPRGVYWSPGVLRHADRTPPTGLVRAGGLLRMGIVVASELPRDRSTILARLMAGGPGLFEAIADLKTLPRDAHERVLATPVLLRLKHALERARKRTAKEEDFIVRTHDIVGEIQDKGRQEGRQEHARATLRLILGKRHLTPTSRDEARIDRCDDVRTLDRWIARALTAESAREALRATPARRRKTARAS